MSRSGHDGGSCLRKAQYLKRGDRNGAAAIENDGRINRHQWHHLSNFNPREQRLYVISLQPLQW
jgi:hypothetical protein